MSALFIVIAFRWSQTSRWPSCFFFCRVSVQKCGWTSSSVPSLSQFCYMHGSLIAHWALQEPFKAFAFLDFSDRKIWNIEPRYTSLVVSTLQPTSVACFFLALWADMRDTTLRRRKVLSKPCWLFMLTFVCLFAGPTWSPWWRRPSGKRWRKGERRCVLWLINSLLQWALWFFSVFGFFFHLPALFRSIINLKYFHDVQKNYLRHVSDFWIITQCSDFLIPLQIWFWH